MAQLPITAATVFNRLLTRTRLKHLHVVTLTAELGSTQGAASELGISQSVASKAITELESLLQTSLFQRHARGMTPTAACLDILPMLRITMRSLSACAESLAEHGSGGRSLIRIGAVMSSIPGGLSRLLPLFAKRFPQLRFEVVEEVLATLLSRYAAGELDVVLMRRPAQVPAGSEFTSLWNDHCFIVAGPQNPLATAKSLTLDRLATERWVLGPLGTRMRQVFDKVHADLGQFPQQTQLVTSSMIMLLGYLQNMPAVAMMPASVAVPYAGMGLVSILPVKLDLPIEEIGVLGKVEGVMHSTTQFVDFLAAHRLQADLEPS